MYDSFAHSTFRRDLLYFVLLFEYIAFAYSAPVLYLRDAELEGVPQNNPSIDVTVILFLLALNILRGFISSNRRGQRSPIFINNTGNTDVRPAPTFLATSPMFFSGFVNAMFPPPIPIIQSAMYPQPTKPKHLNSQELDAYPILQLSDALKVKDKCIPDTAKESEIKNIDPDIALTRA
ncbi:hypothetical protein BB560_001235 [Smittium megazygosporum]|uniref:Uncharacterized protein n=1 Tax=Smittium megazygosporum TaxID=133381 RepID=A0A2T9ZI80_9FUNG|nr:hypothetical protein BB560_001235 [Smittium megazygosporum]